MKLIIGVAAILFIGLGSLAAQKLTSVTPISTETGVSAVNETPLDLSTSYEIASSVAIPNFILNNQLGKEFTNAQLKGKWSLIYVGYTSCPDICPTMTSKLAAAYNQLSAEINIQVIFISVDPARDNQQKLKEYMDFFEPEFIAVTAGHSQLVPLTRNLGFAYAMVGDEPDYQVDHSASLVLLSPQGKRVAIIKPQATELGKLPQISNKALIQDIKLIVNKYS